MPFLLSAFHESFSQLLHGLSGALAAHGPAQRVGLARGEAGYGHGHLDHLFLVDDDPQGLLEHRLQAGVEVAHLLLSLPAVEVGMDGVALDGAGPDDGHFGHQVLEAPGPGAGEGGLLGPGFHLEHAQGIAPAQHVVDAGIVQGNAVQVQVYAPAFA